MSYEQQLIEAEALREAENVVVVDCRFSLKDPDAGRAAYEAGHIPGACYLDLNRDLSSPVQAHGGRHPLPDAATLARTLADCGIGPQTAVVAYDDSGFAFAARLWWLLRSLGYRSPRLLNGGYAAWLQAGGEVEQGVSRPVAVGDICVDARLRGSCDIDGLAQLQGAGALLVDSREPRRYQGLEEPIDPVAGHIPGAVNHPWQGVTDEAGRALDEAGQRAHWGSTLDAPELVVYCGSGVTACVNLFSLALLGRDDATLYAGSWSDWCSYL
ncbi:sulfurtransferase [Seongchinamella unica]|uniref:Sulfurtransferase n=1 Tax=Seongchinamella unica TaxID=2547392 RepID=A0A4R5LUH4_9GAMM|nr:sulfurtransferase [Seongchinamella unica]TDG15002.1 sulfurtransferase [Seongchinamella unica]